MPLIYNITDIADLRDTTLRDRATRAHGPRSEEFVALVRAEEAGLLSYEDWSDRGSAFVYEIFVLPNYRRQGLGAAMLLHAERYAVQLNCENIRLKPHALDREPTDAQLRAWYKNLGYSEMADDPELMEKRLPGRSAA